MPNMKGGSTALVNPGTVGGVAGAAATWLLGDLDTLEFEIREVSKVLEHGAPAVAG